MKSYSILFLVALFTFSLAYSQSWQKINSLSGGEITAVASDNNNGILYGGTVLDGVYKSTNDGVSWTHLSLINIDQVRRNSSK